MDFVKFPEYLEMKIMMKIDQDTKMPTKTYDSRISVCLNEENDNLEIATVDFNMA